MPKSKRGRTPTPQDESPPQPTGELTGEPVPELVDDLDDEPGPPADLGQTTDYTRRVGGYVLTPYGWQLEQTPEQHPDQH